MVRQRGKNSDAPHATTENEENLVIPQDEQLRLVRESGILQEIDRASPNQPINDDPEEMPLSEEIFHAVLLITPFSFLLLLMNILIHFQYGREPSLWDLADRMVTGIPILSVFIFYTMRYKPHRRMQTFLFALAILAGCRMLFIVNHKPWLVNMRQCPPLATLWIYAIVQLELGPAVVSLIVVGAFVWWNGLRLSFS
ncbi:hypothetical protein JOM56_008667 [Amanita muscaria]